MSIAIAKPRQNPLVANGFGTYRTPLDTVLHA